METAVGRGTSSMRKTVERGIEGWRRNGIASGNWGMDKVDNHGGAEWGRAGWGEKLEWNWWGDNRRE